MVGTSITVNNKQLSVEPGPSWRAIPEERLIPGTRRKRAHSPDEHSCKNNKCFVKVALQAESDQPTDEDTESMYSFQLDDTASAKDTSDTSSSSESVTMNVEFEVDSLSEEKQFSSDSSSGTDGFLAAVGVLAATVDEDPAFWADSSDADYDCSKDSEVPRADYWSCVRCKCENNNPLFRYCERCFQIRKDYFPERPKRSRQRRTVPGRKVEAVDVAVGGPDEKDNNSDLDSPICKEDSKESVAVCDSAIESDLSQSLLPGTSQSLQVQTSVLASSSAESDLCFMCVKRPKNGCFIHKKIVHVLCCYTCTVKVWKGPGRCPVCNQKPLNIARLIFG